MAALGIPSTRAASLVTSDLYVSRDPLNSGRRVPERCSVVLRLAPSFIRQEISKMFPDFHQHKKKVTYNTVSEVSLTFVLDLDLLRSFWAVMSSQACRGPVQGGMTFGLGCWIMSSRPFILASSRLIATGKIGIWPFLER